jgi:hypothetical protein
MEIHINARMNGMSDEGVYEAAYRSVFVFNNTTLNDTDPIPSPVPGVDWLANGRPRVLDIAQSGGDANNAILDPAHRDLGRMWIRGGDSASGNVSLPDFPIDRDRSLWRKTRLMTPIDPSGGSFNNLANASNVAITNAWVPNGLAAPNGRGNYNNNGNYLWFWVTWRVNVLYTYIDPMCGTLPTVAEYSAIPLEAPRQTKDLYMAYVPFKEHYPLIRGRTTVIEARHVYCYLIDGRNGPLDFGSVAYVPSPRDYP